MKKNTFINRNVYIFPVFLLMAGFLLVGCGGQNPEDDPNDPTPPQGVTETPATPETETPEAETPETETPEGLSEDELSQLFGRGRGLDELFYEMTVSAKGSEAAVTRIYVKGDHMRMEGEAMGQRFIMIYGEDAFYTLDPSTKTGMKMPLAVGGEDDEEDEDYEEEEVFTLDRLTEGVDANTLRYIGKESVGGVSCHIVESKETETGHLMRMWLHEEYGFPMKTETISENGEVQLLMEVTEFEVGNIAEDLFIVPTDYQILDLGSLIPSGP